MRWIKLFSSLEEASSHMQEGKPFTVAIDSLSLCLIRHQHTLSAFQSHCPHAGASLSEAFCNSKKEIVCPRHGYRFELTSGREMSGQPYDLKLYPIQLTEEGIFIGLP
jgi:3-phenylpropionate/trans-cinnamate dioxygenase ferredoxin subunit